MSLIRQADVLVRTSLAAFAAEVGASEWSGRRENEARDLYAFGYLVPRCRPGGFLHDPTQIALDVPVPQIEPDRQRRLSQEFGRGTGSGTPKADVAKDLLIWPRPRMTCWVNGEAAEHPTVVMEWKVDQANVDAYDVDWLRAFSAERDDFVGYALTFDLKRRRFLLSCTRVRRGDAAPGWLVLR